MKTYTTKGAYIQLDRDECDNSELVIEDLFVPNELRGKGIARQLVEKAIAYASKKGFAKIGLFANVTDDSGLDQDSLIGFYKSCGFNSHGDMDELMYYAV